VIGWDATGIVVEAGLQATLFKVGDEVFYAGSIARPGTNAQFHLVDERIVGHKPRSGPTNDVSTTTMVPQIDSCRLAATPQSAELGRYCCKSPRGAARPGKFGNNRIRMAGSVNQIPDSI
jgi:hypothetical protein